MIGETPFRVALAVMLAITVGVGGYHRWQAAKSGEKISRRDEGRLLFFAIRFSGLAMFVVVVAYLIDSQSFRWATLGLPFSVRWSGAVLGAIAAGLLYWTLNALGTNLTDTVVTRRKHTLITTGPYRWIRHPFYVTLLMYVFATSLLAANWLMAVAGVVVFVLLAVRVPIEERKLAERFGDEYLAYRARTGRFLPRLRRD